MKCKYGCGKPIEWSRDIKTDKWIPYNVGTWEVHSCQETEQHRKQRLVREADKQAKRFGLYEQD